LILVIDKIIGTKVVCIEDETSKEIIFNKIDMPKQIKEGDTLSFENGTIKHRKDLAKTRRQEIDKLLNDIFK
jgi:hypothetical protein